MTLQELAKELHKECAGRFNGYKNVSERWLATYVAAMTQTETGKAVVAMETVHGGEFVYVKISRDGDAYGYEFSDSFR